MAEDFLLLTNREFRRLKNLAERAVAQLPTEAIFAVPGEGDNSIAVVLKHLSGNIRSRWENFLTADGEKPDRDRDSEFVIGPNDSHPALLARWEEAWTILFSELEALSSADLERTVRIRGESLTVLQAIMRQISHQSYHVGQIVYVAKHFRGRDWTSLSIPVGGSKAFNEKPARYLETR